MRRAGWAIYMAPEMGGSFEEVPPSMLDFASRDRRWCQGNLQHIAVLPVRGLRWVSRLHLLTGIGAYITAPMWLIFLILGLLISLQANFIRPEYFPKGFSLFPTWPQQDAVLAAWVFGATMGLLVVPKILAYLVLISRRRSGGEIARGEIYRKLATPTLCGISMGLSAYAVSVPLLLWMSPVIAGLLLAVPLGFLTSRRSGRAMLFATPEDDRPPPVVHRANDLAASARVEMTGALPQLGEDAELLTYHLASLPQGRQSRFGRIDVPLATARAKIERCELFDDVVKWLDKSETRAVLNDAATLQCVLEMRRSVPAT